MKVPETKEERLAYSIIEIARMVSRSDIPSEYFDIVFNRTVDEYIAMQNVGELTLPISDAVADALKKGIESVHKATTTVVKSVPKQKPDGDRVGSNHS